MLDNLVGMFSPDAGLRRVMARGAFDRARTSYESGRIDRNTARWMTRPESGESPSREEIQRLRQRAWHLFRNDVYARRMVRAAISKIVGCGLMPQSQALTRSGEPDQEFRKRAEALWKLWGMNVSAIGAPGRGGMNWAQFLRMAWRELILSGECFVRVRQLTRDQSDGRASPITLELISAERVIEDEILGGQNQLIGVDHTVYRGIEFDNQGRRVNYFVWDYHPQDPRVFLRRREPVPIPASEILHFFVGDRPDQVRGVSWFAPAIMMLRDVSDYQEDEMKAAMASACVTMAITRQPGSGPIGLQASSDARTVDEDGNPIRRLQPAMVLDLRPGESIESFNPMRPSAGAEGFISHMLRSVSGAIPGIKASTITGDYRASSFSSERSADNDSWPEIEICQEETAAILCQPLWEEVINAGVNDNWFEEMDLRTFKKDRWGEYRVHYLAANWSGPLARSINPVDDETASEKAIANGTSSLPIEAAARGLDWERVLDDQARVAAKRKALGLADPAAPPAPADSAKGASDNKVSDIKEPASATY